MTKLSSQTRDKLKTVSTATLTTALFKRGLQHQMIQDVHPLNPHALPMVGEAFTLRYIPAHHGLDHDRNGLALRVLFHGAARHPGVPDLVEGRLQPGPASSHRHCGARLHGARRGAGEHGSTAREKRSRAHGR